MNQRIQLALREGAVSTIVLDTSGSALNEVTIVRGLKRLPTVVRALADLVKFGKANPRGAVYLCVSGGYGQLFDALCAVLARMVGAVLYLQHHSYDYVRCGRRRTVVLLWAAGRGATHVVLCEDMENRLLSLYSSVRRTLLVSTAGSTLVTEPRARSGLTTIGFLGNISKAKGLEEFLKVAAELQERGYKARALLAGPLMDREARRLVELSLDGIRGLEYRGPQYGREKAVFYSEIDVLLFPSRYRHEAEPTVMHEAMAAGAAVIAWDRGCVRGMSPSVVVPEAEDFVQTGVAQLIDWFRSSSDMRAASQDAICVARSASALGNQQLERLLRELAPCWKRSSGPGNNSSA